VTFRSFLFAQANEPCFGWCIDVYGQQWNKDKLLISLSIAGIDCIKDWGEELSWLIENPWVGTTCSGLIVLPTFQLIKMLHKNQLVRLLMLLFQLLVAYTPCCSRLKRQPIGLVRLSRDYGKSTISKIQQPTMGEFNYGSAVYCSPWPRWASYPAS